MDQPSKEEITLLILAGLHTIKSVCDCDRCDQEGRPWYDANGNPVGGWKKVLYGNK